VKLKKPIVSGIVLFIILLVSDILFQYRYYERSLTRLERCADRNSEIASPWAICSQAISAADSAFSSATANHLLTYFVIFCLFLVLVTKLEKMETRLKQLEDHNNV
jgi:hypothetical protein